VLTFIEAISLAGDRKKQNDDAYGAARTWGWVIDGATDLHDTPISNYASDAAWIATYLSERLASSAIAYDIYGTDAETLRGEVKSASDALVKDWSFDWPIDVERWRLPTASALVISDHESETLEVLELGDCRCFVLDAAGLVHAIGGSTVASINEATAAAEAAKQSGGQPLLRDQQTVLRLRDKRAQHNKPDGYWVFGLQSECADHARAWSLNVARPAHVLLMTDGFAALVDRYRAYDAAGLVQAALDKGLQELGRELRAIEAADASGAKHPRFKASDDATALLLRLS
jgi:hypothetical protein